MSIKATLSSDGLQEVYTPPTLKQMCLYKCLTNKEILTKEVEVDEDMDGSKKLDWEKYRLKEPIQRDLVEALLDAGDKLLFMLTPNYEPVLAAIRMSQPEHLVKVHVNNTHTLVDRQLELLISGGHVRSLDINSCISLKRGSLDAINKFGGKLEYLRIGDCRVLPYPSSFDKNSAILRTPNVKTFIVCEIYCRRRNTSNYWRFLLQDFISNLEDLQISNSTRFQTLEFLEPARSKLSSLTLRDCKIARNANAWASLFNLDKLRFLDVAGSSMEKAFVGEDVVQRLLTAMPNLKILAVDPGLLKNIYVDSSIRGQGSLSKRLEFLGIMDNDEDATDETELKKAKLLANEVAYFGTVEGELRVLECFSNRLNAGSFDPTLELLLIGFSDVAPWNTVTVIGLLMKTVRNHGVDVVSPHVFFEYLTPLLTPDIWGKLGEVLRDQCVGAIFAYMSRWYLEDAETGPGTISDVIDIMMNLEGELRFDHYLTLVPMVMSVAGRAMKTVLHDFGMEYFKDLLRKIAALLEKAVDRFPGEINALWGISSVLIVAKELRKVMVSRKHDTNGLMDAFSGMIKSLRKLCLTSGPRRAAFHSAEGVDILMELLTEIIDGCLGLADRDSFALLEILQSILHDTNLNLSESGMIASRLEKLLLSVHSKWEFWKCNPVRETMYYYQFKSIANLLNILENDPRYDYDASAEVKEIIMKLK